MRAEMEANVNGTRIYYEIQGAGSPLALIHGIGGSAMDWGEALPRLAAHCRVLALDVRGFGHSAKPSGPYSPAQWAADVAGVLDAAGMRDVIVLGHSMGGVIAQRLVLDFPQKVRAAIFASTSSEVKEAAAQFWEGQADEIEREGIAPMIARRQAAYTDAFKAAHPEALAADERRVQLNEPHAYAAAARAVARYNFTDELRGLHMPVLILQGLDDKQTPPGGSVIMSRAIPGARLVMIEHCGHNIHSDQPDRFVNEVLGFVAEVTGAAQPAGD
ncbi:MAG TPA: alpha/beta fold hydrolase [Dehalococcoidia bacterium]|nr:alpha/beta fold hydrolase [Dehalococcoidia bacterium]